MDVLTKDQRSYNMSRIRSKNTRPEKLLFKLLRAKGISYRKHLNLPGKPDVGISGYKLILFVDGEFWHGKDFDNWKAKLQPFWLNKISENIRRDKRNDRILRKSGWHVFHIWGLDIIKKPQKCLLRIERFIFNNSNAN